ncbi:hypothetical protein ACFYO2_49655, partial [Streptomyces sp. NPDC006602]
MATVIDLAKLPVRELNQALHAPGSDAWRVLNPRGAHAVACGIREHHTVDIEGHVGYYCAGMNQHATVTVHGNAGTGVAENMMSGTVRVRGNASQSAGATAHGGLLVVDGDASARCGISLTLSSLKGGDSYGSRRETSCFIADCPPGELR